MAENPDREEMSILLARFNKRDVLAFATVYKKIFVELYAYARCLYNNTTTDPEDVVQDAFSYLWEQRKLVFDRMFKIKAFLFVVIKNRYFHYLDHLGVVDKYKQVVEYENRFTSDVVYCEQLSMLMEYVERIPGVGREVIKLYLDGYEAEDIAEKMQMNVQSVYNIKSQTIRRLKNLFSSKK